MKPQVVIFDLGGVLFDFDKEYFRERLNFFNGDIWRQYEIGRVSSEDVYKEFCETTGYGGSFEDFCVDFRADLQLNEEMFDFFLALKMAHCETVRFWILSNTNEICFNFVMANWPGVLNNFHPWFMSHKMGVRKPEPEIYQRMLQETRMTPYNCLFIDDNEENVEYPRHIGMPFIHFQDLEQLKRELARYELTT